MSEALPDWRSGRGYPDAKTTTPRTWAWEFLRRNPEYVADWQRYDDCQSAIRKKYGRKLPGDREPTEFAFMNDDALGSVYEPLRQAKETHEQWAARVQTGKVAPLASWLARKWGLSSEPADPAQTRVPSWVSIQIEQVTNASERPIAIDELMIVLKLRLPLGPQLARVEKLFAGERRRKQSQLEALAGVSRNRSGRLFRDYLRVLDGLQALGVQTVSAVPGAALKALGAALRPRNTNGEGQRDATMRAMIRAARRLRDHDYRALPALAPVKEN